MAEHCNRSGLRGLVAGCRGRLRRLGRHGRVCRSVWCGDPHHSIRPRASHSGATAQRHRVGSAVPVGWIDHRRSGGTRDALQPQRRAHPGPGARALALADAGGGVRVTCTLAVSQAHTIAARRHADPPLRVPDAARRGSAATHRFVAVVDDVAARRSIRHSGHVSGSVRGAAHAGARATRRPLGCGRSALGEHGARDSQPAGSHREQRRHAT